MVAFLFCVCLHLQWESWFGWLGKAQALFGGAFQGSSELWRQLQLGALIGRLLAENLAAASAFRNLPSPSNFSRSRPPSCPSLLARYRSFRRNPASHGRHLQLLPPGRPFSAPPPEHRSPRRYQFDPAILPASRFPPLPAKMSFALVARRSGLSMGRRMVRFESTTTKAADAAKQTAEKASSTASEYSAKASEGLSRVSSAAGPAIANAAKGITGALGRVGGRTARLAAFVERKDTPLASPTASPASSAVCSAVGPQPAGCPGCDE